jgi:hypothetical protein
MYKVLGRRKRGEKRRKERARGYFLAGPGRGPRAAAALSGRVASLDDQAELGGKWKGWRAGKRGDRGCDRLAAAQPRVVVALGARPDRAPMACDGALGHVGERRTCTVVINFDQLR